MRLPIRIFLGGLALTLLLGGVVAAGFLALERTARSVDALVEKEFAVSGLLAQCNELVVMLHSEVWDALLSPPQERDSAQRQLDGLAKRFYANLRTLRDRPDADERALEALHLSFESYYLCGSTLLGVQDAAGLKARRDLVEKFVANKRELSSQLALRVEPSRLAFASSLQRLRQAFSTARVLTALFLVVALGLAVALLVAVARLVEAHGEVRALNQNLEQRVAERTDELARANRELETFSYSVSHDLRAPLRHIAGFVALLRKKHEAALDDQGRHYLEAISAATARMDRLIRDLLDFSRMARWENGRTRVELGALVDDVLREVAAECGEREIEWRVAELPAVTGEPAMLRLALVNLVANALKFTRTRARAEIEIGCLPGTGNEVAVFVRDNGVGFDMKFADKLFGVFQRLHAAEEFEGTGIGLANVRRVVERHGGRTWAEGRVGEGATFYFSLPPWA